MKQKSIIDALTDCADSCGWCVNHCPDEDKYEMLITCISIRKEFTRVGSIVNLILGNRSFEPMKKIIGLFEVLAEDPPIMQSSINQNNFKIDFNSDDSRRLPGCSQIFNVAQSLEWVYVKEDLRFDSD